jgi:glycosyltransferase involved in cell wall biosynthesis
VKVLHISADALVGGVESLLITLARGKTIDPTAVHDFAFTATGPALDALRNAGARVHYLGGVSPKRPRDFYLARRRLKEACREHGYDVAVFHQYPYLIAAFADVLWRDEVKTVRYFHNETVPGSRFEQIVRLIYSRTLDLSVVNSQFLLQCNPGIKRTIVYCPVDRQVELTDEERREIRSRFATLFEEPLIIQVCRMTERKGHARLLRSLATLNSLPWTCWIVGGPQKDRELDYFESLKRLVADLGITDRVRFLGIRSDVPDLLAAADIFCHPNTYPPEPFGIAMVEALQAGLPVVTSAMGGALEIVSDECGFLVPPEDDAALSSALRRLLTESGLRRQMSASARKRGESFTARVQIPLLNAALKTAL